MELELETKEQQVKFLGTCAEFIPFMSVDCPGLSPGNEHFKLSVDGLTYLKAKLPEHESVIQRAINFYSTLAKTVLGPYASLYPPGSQIFDDLSSLDDLHGKLLDVVYELEG